MNRHIFSLIIGIAGLPLIVPVVTHAWAADRFTCRASAIRIVLPLGQVLEPVVANPPEDPCETDSEKAASISTPTGVSTGTMLAKTEGAPAPVSARAKVERLALVNVLDLVNLRARTVRSRARVVSTAQGACKLKSSSSLETLVVQGQKFPLLDTPLDLDIKLLNIVVAKLRLNATLGGPNPTVGPPDPTKITQRAVWFHVTDPTLRAILFDVIVAEATVDTHGDPC